MRPGLIIGYRDALIAERNAILSNVRPAHRWRLLGVRPRWAPAKVHTITIDLRRPEERTVDTTLAIVRPPTVPARNPFRPQPAKNEFPRVCWRILDAVATAWGVTIDDLRSPKRCRSFAHPRFAAMLLIRESTGWSTPRIGRAFGGRDHTSVLAALRRAEELFAVDLAYRERYHDVLASLADEMPAESAT